MKPEKNLIFEDLKLHQIKNQVEELLNVAAALREAISQKTLKGNNRHEKMILSLEKMIISLAHSIKLTNSTSYFVEYKKKDGSKHYLLLDAVREAKDLVATSINLYGIKINGEERIPPDLKIGVSLFLSTFVLTVLINNAKDAIKDGDISNGLISIEVEEKLEEILVHIVDNGPGIPEKVCVALFMKPINSTKPFGGGNGLYLSNSELKKNQGYIELTSRSNPTKFTIHFPKFKKERQERSKLNKKEML